MKRGDENGSKQAEREGDKGKYLKVFSPVVEEGGGDVWWAVVPAHESDNPESMGQRGVA